MNSDINDEIILKDIDIPNYINEDIEAIHKRMLEKCPPNISAVEGDFFWDVTRPVAEEHERFINFKLQNFLKLAFPQTSYGIYLDYLGETRGVFRLQPTKATGIITVKGSEGTIIPKGTVFSTSASDTLQPIEFISIKDKEIDATGTCLVEAECNQAGIIGNVIKGSIDVIVSPIKNISSIKNEEDFRNGTDVEDEEDFRQRIMESYMNIASSGNPAHYEKWAKEVNGVGYAKCYPLWNGEGTVKVSILDANGDIANQDLINKVQEYIAPLVENRHGKAPIGAKVTITTPSYLMIDVKANFTIKRDYDETEVLERLKVKIDKYLVNLPTDNEAKYSAISTVIGSMIINDEGILDFSNLTINDSTENISLVGYVGKVGSITNNV